MVALLSRVSRSPYGLELTLALSTQTHTCVLACLPSPTAPHLPLGRLFLLGIHLPISRMPGAQWRSASQLIKENGRMHAKVLIRAVDRGQD